MTFTKAVFVYVVDHLPHPQIEHLESRIRGLGMIHKYEQGVGGQNCALIVVEGLASTSDIDLNDAVVEYFHDRNVDVFSFCKVPLGGA